MRTNMSFELTAAHKTYFREYGYLVITNLLNKSEISYYNKVYNGFLDNSINASKYRSDLSGAKNSNSEKITQIMVPSKVFPELLEKPLHKKTLSIAKGLLGEDMALDFDMMINKGPRTNAITPWHQDAAYWIDLPDKRAVSCWVAIDRAFADNGCMWYVPKSHLQPVLPHIQTGNKGALKCEGNEENAVCVELEAGSCVLHQGGTLHYSRGNTTQYHRKALITNYRPISMISLEREKGVDHTGERKINTNKNT